MAVSVTQQNRIDVSNLYVALFARAPDGEGLGFWSSELANGKTVAQVADTMFATAPARVTYPSFATNAEIITSFYTKVLGRAPDTEGLAFWTSKLNAPSATPGSVIVEMINVVNAFVASTPALPTDAAAQLSKDLFTNKADVALYFGLANSSIAVAQSALVNVTADPATVVAAKALIVTVDSLTAASMAAQAASVAAHTAVTDAQAALAAAVTAKTTADAAKVAADTAADATDAAALTAASTAAAAAKATADAAVVTATTSKATADANVVTTQAALLVAVTADPTSSLPATVAAASAANTATAIAAARATALTDAVTAAATASTSATTAADAAAAATALDAAAATAAAAATTAATSVTAATATVAAKVLLDQAAAAAFATAAAATVSLTDDAAAAAAVAAAGPVAPQPPVTNPAYVLTTGLDTKTADNFFASQTVFNIDGKGPTLNAGDNLTGTAGKTDNSLTVTDLTAGAAFNNIPAGVVLTNIQNVVLSSSGNTAGGTGFSTVGYADVRNLTANTNGGVNDTFAAKNGVNGTAVTATHNGFTGNMTVVGGTNVTATTAGGNVIVGSTAAVIVPLASQVATGAVVVNQNFTGAGAVGVFGGTTVNVVTSSTSNSGAIDIGNTAVNTGNSSAGAVANASGNITVSTKGTGAVTAFGGADVSINNTALAGAGNITVGDVGYVTASNLPTGNVTVAEAAAIAYNGLAGSSNNNTASGAINVFGGKDVTITTNAANGINVGNLGAANEVALNPKGKITVTNTGIVNAAAATGQVLITGGTDVSVTTTGAGVTIGRAAGGVALATSNPTGNVMVTETMNGAGFTRNIVIDGGKDITVNAKGQAVFVGTSVASAPTGAVVVNQADIFTGNTNAILNGTNSGNVTVTGGTSVTVNTTGGNVVVGGVVGGVNTVPSGAVKITNTFGGVGADSVTVAGGTTVDITTTKTVGAINVGAASAALNAAGTALKDANLAPTGNVTIVNKTTSGTVTAYGTGAVDALTNGATTVSITGGDADTITDIQSTLATGGSNAGKAIGTSTLKTVVIDSLQVADGVAINSDALTELSVLNTLRLSDAITVTNNTAAHALTITQGNNTSLATAIQTITVTDAKAGSITVKDNGVASNTVLRVDATKATAVTLENGAAATVKLDGVSSDIATVTLKGAGAATLVGTLGTGSLSKALTVDASAATGNVTAALQMTTTVDQVQSYKGGSAVDTITINSNASGWSSKATIDGGNGSADVLVANFAAAGTDVALGNAANVKGFEVLRMGADATGTYDASGFSTVQAGVIANAVTFSNAATGLTLDLRADNTNDAITVAGANYSATTTAMTVNLGSGTAVITGANGAITANAIEALTVNSVGKTAAGAGSVATINGIASNGAATLTVGGAADLALSSNTGFTSINASGNTGTTVDVTAAKVSNAGVTFTGGASKLVATGSNDSGNIKALVTLASTSATPILATEAVTVNIDGTTFVYLATATTTVAEAAASIAALINAQTGNGATNVVAGKGTTTQTGPNVLTATAATASGGNIVLSHTAAFEVLTSETVVAATTTITDSLLGGQQQNVITIGAGTGVEADDVYSIVINGAAPITATGATSTTTAATALALAITTASPAGIASAVAVGSTVLVTSQLGQTNQVSVAAAATAGTVGTIADVTSVNMATVNNAFVTGAGGGTYKAGLGGSWNTVTHKFSSGSETITLDASTAKSDSLLLKEGAVVTDNSVKGGVTQFVVGSQAASDSLTFRNTADNADLAKTILTNAVTGVVNTVNGAAAMANVLDSSGALNTALANLTFTVSNGVITFGATGGNSLSQFTVNQLINAAQILVSSSTTGGANKVAAFSHNGRSYVVSSDNGNTLNSNVDTKTTIVELKDVASVKGFGSTFGDATIVSSTVTNLTNAAIDLAALATSSNLDYTGFAKATLSVTGTNGANTNTTKFANLAASAELVVNAVTNVNLGLLETTQVGASGKNSLTVTQSTNASTIDRLTVNGDALVQFKNGGQAFIVTELVDATNTMNTVTVGAGVGATTIGKITGTALTNINTTAATGTVNLGSGGDAIAQNSLKFDLAVGQAANIFTSGTGDTFTQGSAINVGTGVVTLTASGANNTITLSNGNNVITANGAGAKITVGTGTNTITATGADDVITIAANANITTVTVGTNAAVTVGTNDVVKVNGAVSGGTADSYAKTTVSFATGTVATGNVIDFDDAGGVAYGLLGASVAASQVNVASATSLAQALNMAANHTLLTQDQGIAATATVGAGGGALAANTAAITWFQYGGDTYVVAAVNNTAVAVQQTALDANDIVVKLTGMVDLTGSAFNAGAGVETLTL